MAHRTGLVKVAVAAALLGLPLLSVETPRLLEGARGDLRPVEPIVAEPLSFAEVVPVEGGARPGKPRNAEDQRVRLAPLNEHAKTLNATIKPDPPRAKLPDRPLVEFLPIAPKFQQTPVWCWLAVGEMVFNHFAVPEVNPNFQCGIVAADSIATNMEMCSRDCSLCNVPVGTSREFAGMLVDYPRRAAALTGRKTPRVFAAISGVLGIDAIVGEIDRGSPVVAGISPGGVSGTFQTSAHVALIIGYDLSTDANKPRLRVNDPFPFPEAANPYLAAGATSPAAGSYSIPYETFKHALGWTESFLVRVQGEHDPLESVASARPRASQCVTSTEVQCEMRVDAPAGSACFCLVPPGQVVPGVVRTP